MKNFILSFIFVLVAVSSASAYDFIEGGIAYDILGDGTLSVTHRWELPPRVKERINPRKFAFTDPRDSENLSSKLYKGTVKIPSTVKHKGREYKVTEIGYHAFFCCERLIALILPEGLRRMDYQSVVLTKIKSLDIPSTVTEIVPGAVTQCKLLANLTVSPGNPKYVSEGNCIYTKNMKQLVMVSPTLKSYEFPPTVTGIQDFAFDSSTITRLVIPETVEYIGGLAFPMSAHIGSIVCDKVLKKLPGSNNYFPRSAALPDWAIGKGVYERIEPPKGKGNKRQKGNKEVLCIYPHCIYEKNPVPLP